MIFRYTMSMLTGLLNVRIVHIFSVVSKETMNILRRIPSGNLPRMKSALERFLSMCPTHTFRDVNGSCIDCPPGFTDPNCSTTCPNGTYGAGCRYRCICAGCDPVSGCSSTSAIDVPPAEGPEHTVISLVLLIVILAIVGFNFAVSIILLWRFSTSYAQQRHEDRTPKESSNQGTIEEIEMGAEGYESPIIPTERSEMRVYTELS